MAARNQSARSSSLPEFAVPAGKKLWEMGEKRNWNALDALLRPLDLGTFWVVDEATDTYLAGIREKFDNSCHPVSGEGVLQRVLGDGDNLPLFQKVLALGVNPDLPDADSCRPSHDSAWYRRRRCAKVLALCRPSLTAQNTSFETVSQIARQMGNKGVIAVWENVEEDGFPSVAKLAFSEEWAALQNLCRRRVITACEAIEKFDGKNAVEWAEHHGEMDLAKELRYLLNIPASDDVRPLARKAKTFFSDTQSRIEALNEQLVLAVESMSKTNGEIAELRREMYSLKTGLARKEEEISELKKEFKIDLAKKDQEMSEVKNSLATDIAKKDEEISGLKETLAALQNKTKNLARGVDELNGVFEFLKTSE